MTKQEELAAWRNFAATMPPAETYSGQWIREQIEFLEADLRADWPAGTIAASFATCQEAHDRAQELARETLDKARAEAARTTADARAAAERITQDARDRAQRIRESLADAIRTAARAIDA